MNALFLHGGKVTAQVTKDGRTILGAKTPRNLLAQFHHAKIGFGPIVIWRDIRIGHEGKNPVFLLDQTLLQPALLRLVQRHTVQGIQRIRVRLDDGFSKLRGNLCLPDRFSGPLTFAS